MKLSQLQNFVRVVEIGNLSTAAKAVNIVQPALSRQVKALELELGVQLLKRHPWGVEATSAGKSLAASVRRILSDIERARAQVHALEHEPAGVVAIGAISSLARALFLPLHERVSSLYPKIQLRLRDRSVSELVRELGDAALDIALVQKRRNEAGITFEPLLSDEYGLLAPRNIASRLGPNPERQLTEIPLIVSSPPNDARARIEEAIGAGSLMIACEVDGLESVLSILISGAGAAILPCCAAEEHIAKGVLSFIPLGPKLRREIVVGRQASSHQNRSVAAVEQIIRDIVDELAPRMRWTPASSRSSMNSR